MLNILNLQGLPIEKGEDKDGVMISSMSNQACSSMSTGGC